MKLVFFLIYLIGSFFAFGAGIDEAKQREQKFAFPTWLLVSIILVIVLVVS